MGFLCKIFLRLFLDLNQVFLPFPIHQNENFNGKKHTRNLTLKLLQSFNMPPHLILKICTAHFNYYFFVADRVIY